MHKFTYENLRKDIVALVSETESHGGSISGGLGRAFVEYWLDSDVLAEVYPTPRPLKLMVIMTIFTHMKKYAIALDEEDMLIAQWLVDNLSIDDLMAMFSQEDIELMLRDAKQTLPESIFNELEAKFGAAPA
jgi:hypothetical protein